MLGTTDESHIIRCIEYWDIERKRYPQYDHCAVLIAENVTSRFLNVLSLFNGHIPMIVIQLDALKVGDSVVLNFVKVMDRFELRRDDEVETKLAETDRNYWNNKATKETVGITDEVLTIINSKSSTKQQLNYNKHYIGLKDDIKSRNFIYFKPKKSFTHLFAEVDNKNEWGERFDNKNISFTTHKNHIQITLKPKDLSKNLEFITEFISESVNKYNN